MCGKFKERHPRWPKDLLCWARMKSGTCQAWHVVNERCQAIYLFSPQSYCARGTGYYAGRCARGRLPLLLLNWLSGRIRASRRFQRRAWVNAVTAPVQDALGTGSRYISQARLSKGKERGAQRERQQGSQTGPWARGFYNPVYYNRLGNVQTIKTCLGSIADQLNQTFWEWDSGDAVF